MHVECKGQMKSECIYEIIDFPKYHRKNLIDFCPVSLFRLGMLCTHLNSVPLRIIKTNHMYSHLSNKRGGGAKVVESINVEGEISQLESSPFVFK